MTISLDCLNIYIIHPGISLDKNYFWRNIRDLNMDPGSPHNRLNNCGVRDGCYFFFAIFNPAYLDGRFKEAPCMGMRGRFLTSRLSAFKLCSALDFFKDFFDKFIKFHTSQILLIPGADRNSFSLCFFFADDDHIRHFFHFCIPNFSAY